MRSSVLGFFGILIVILIACVICITFLDFISTFIKCNTNSHDISVEISSTDTSEEVSTNWTGSSNSGLVTYKGRKYSYNTHLSNYLLLGIDTTGEIAVDQDHLHAGQADTIVLISYNRKEKTIRLLAIPRDTITTIYNYNPDGTYVGAMEDHLSLQFAYGDGGYRSCEYTRDAVSNLLYGTPILGYAAINLTSIPILVNAVGGLTVTVPDDSMAEINPDYKAGATISLTAENAEAYLRYRDTSLHNQALVRMERQKSFMSAFASRVRYLQSRDDRTAIDLYEALKLHNVTNMTTDVYVDLCEAAQQGSIVTIPGEGVATEEYDEYHVDEKALYELILDVFYIEESD